tara:strand:+ start:2684 stop:2917 length:234 start_codon:yes stop_codon:yes gene_type:complete
MGDFSLIMIAIACIVFAITIYYQCCACIRDQRYIREVTSPVFPDITLHQDGNLNRMPLTNGVRVDRISEDLEIIMAD